MDDLSQITALLARARAGDPEATEQVIPLLYGELHARAEALMRGERAGVTLQPTALLHEAWLRLKQSPGAPWTDRNHFLRLAGRVMRNVLVDHARRHKAARPEDQEALLSITIGPDQDDRVDMLDLQAAIEQLAKRDPELEQIIELRFFAGMTLQETALALGKSVSAVHRAFELARAFLLRALQ